MNFFLKQKKYVYIYIGTQIDILPPSIIGSLNVESKTSLLNSSLSIFKANTIDDKPENKNKNTEIYRR